MLHFGAVDATVLGALLVAILSPLLSYIIASRKLSGHIKDSEAVELWAESRSIREWSTNRVRELTDQLGELEKRMTELEALNGRLTVENRRLEHEVATLRNDNTELKGKLLAVHELLDHERDLVTRLRAEALKSPRRRYNDPPREGEEGK